MPEDRSRFFARWPTDVFRAQQVAVSSLCPVGALGGWAESQRSTWANDSLLMLARS